MHTGPPLLLLLPVEWLALHLLQCLGVQVLGC
jgi:hypothetical protein